MPASTVQTFFAVGPNCWGSGSTLKEAEKNMRANLPGSVRSDYTVDFIALSVSRDKIQVEEGMGLSLNWPPGAAAVKWQETRKRRG